MTWFSGTHLDGPWLSWGDFLSWDFSLKQKLPLEGEIVSCFIDKSTQLWFHDCKKTLYFLFPANVFPSVCAVGQPCILLVEIEKQ